MDDYSRRLAAAQAELTAAGLETKPRLFDVLLARLSGVEPRPWPYLPLGTRLAAYALPYSLLWTFGNFFLLWKTRAVDPSLAFLSTVMAVSFFAMLMLGFEMRRWHSVKISRWEDL